ncbi:uncharacterized protein LOC133731058 [Rosa rugosa]|uniref:uncharacterized protein LOC133731058 n=1 Tax=Rosa rugosa TaxID=74645 RepID=UPI002B415B60|nr:uncharacterized protein LOC133731058 [Rosa rugosa]
MLTPFPRGYKNIIFSTFSGEDSENAATHLARFKVQCGQYQNDDSLKCKIFGTFLSGAAFTWFSKLRLGLVANWPAIEKLFRETFGAIEPEFDLASLTQMSQQPTDSTIAYLQRFQIQKAKLNMVLPERELAKLAIKGLESRQRKKQHGSMIQSMGELITEDDDEEEENDVSAFELTGRKKLALKQLKKTKEPVKLKSVAFTPKLQFATYTYDANKVHEILDEMIAAKMLKDQIQVWLNNGSLQVETPATAAGLVDLNPFPNTGVNMVYVAWTTKGQRRPTLDMTTRGQEEKNEEEQVPAKKRDRPISEASSAVLCSRCKEECGI